MRKIIFSVVVVWLFKQLQRILRRIFRRALVRL